MKNDFHRNVHCLLGLPFDAVDMQQAKSLVREAAASRVPCVMSTPNLNFVVGSLKDKGFRDSVINSHLSTVDGMPLVWLARLLNIPMPERVAGSDLFEQLRADAGQPLSVYFFGGEEGAAEAAAKCLNASGQGLVCAGYESPGFGEAGDIGDAESVARINASAADFLVVSLGARKGQEWIELNRARITVPVICHLGAVLNFVAGKVSRAPRWMRRTGLEWLWRIKEEPGLWKRYFNDGSALLRLLLTHVLPLAWHQRRHHASAADLAAADCEMRADVGQTVIRLSGAWTQANLDPLRDLFAAAAARGQGVRLEMQRATHVDSAFMGLTMVLFGKLQAQGRDLAVTGCVPSVRRLFQLNCVAFMLRPLDAADALQIVRRNGVPAVATVGARRASASQDLPGHVGVRAAGSSL